MHLWSLLPVPKNATLCSIVSIVYLKVTIIYRYIFSRFWDPKHFTGIKFCDFHTTMQTLAPPCARAQWVARKLSKKIYAASTIEQLMTTATDLSLSCAVWENVINTGPRLYTRYFSTVHERNNPYDRYAVATKRSMPGFVELTVGHLPKEMSRVTRLMQIDEAEE